MTFNWQTLADRKDRLDKESPQSCGPGVVDDSAPVVLVDGVCVARLRSLLIVQAKPLRELGIRRRTWDGGRICLRLRDVPAVSALGGAPREQDRGSGTAALVLGDGWDGCHSESFSSVWVWDLALAGSTPIRLYSIISSRTPSCGTGLEYVDRTGGSNPLTLVVSAADGSKLNTDAAYEKLWRLHGALENNKNVGTVISLPTLLAEGDRTPFSFLISYEKMMEMLEQPNNARVGKSFINEIGPRRCLPFECWRASTTSTALM